MGRSAIRAKITINGRFPGAELSVSAARLYFRSDTGTKGRFITCNHSVKNSVFRAAARRTKRSAAEALVRVERDLLVPDFWPGEATNVLWLQVRRKRLTPEEAREGLALLRTQVLPTPTADVDLHEAAPEIGMAVNHSTYDTLYLAFAIASAAKVVLPTESVELISISC